MTISLEISCDFEDCTNKIRAEDCEAEQPSNPYQHTKSGDNSNDCWRKLHSDLIFSQEWTVDDDEWLFYCPTCAPLADEIKEEAKQGL